MTGRAAFGTSLPPTPAGHKGRVGCGLLPFGQCGCFARADRLLLKASHVRVTARKYLRVVPILTGGLCPIACCLLTHINWECVAVHSIKNVHSFR
jgi:hypothetical protein